MTHSSGYTLYYSQGACSLATQVVLYELNQDVQIVDKNGVKDFTAINPIGAVPVLFDGEQKLTEGAAIMLHLLDKHLSPMLPAKGEARDKAIRDIMFANATMHPAYSRLFFLAGNVSDEKARLEGFAKAAQSINALWKTVDSELTSKPYLGGAQPSAADIMLAVYATWGQYFPVDIQLGAHAERMVNAIYARPSFKRAVETEALKKAS